MNIGLRNISTWAVIAGVMIALSSEVLFNFLGMGIGLTSFDMSADSFFETGIVSALWLFISGNMAMGLGGWISGKLASNCSTKFKMLHGLLAWSFALLITVLASTTVTGTMLGGTSNLVKPNANVDKLSQVSSIVKSNNVGNINKNNILPASNLDEANKLQNVGLAAIAIFLAFTISALSSMFGAYCAKSALINHNKKIKTP